MVALQLKYAAVVLLGVILMNAYKRRRVLLSLFIYCSSRLVCSFLDRHGELVAQSQGGSAASKYLRLYH